MINNFIIEIGNKFVNEVVRTDIIKTDSTPTAY